MKKGSPAKRIGRKDEVKVAEKKKKGSCRRKDEKGVARQKGKKRGSIKGFKRANRKDASV